MSPNPNAEVEIKALLAELWQRHLPSTRERLDTLDRIALSVSANQLDEAARAEGQSVAHKLAGNLGMFGHPAAGEIASEIEQIFKAPTPETLIRVASLVQRLRQTLAPHL
jgi:HPt (histidine-containing phosphotransfer) domain-containing protein